MKQKSKSEMLAVLSNTYRRYIKVVWTNGCYDLFHAGHVNFLKKARCLGDILIVGLNSDDSIQQLKENNRPIFNLTQRLIVLEAIEYIDYIMVFDEISPQYLLETLKPDVFVKGLDYTLDTLNKHEKDIIESYGGKIEFIDSGSQLSTSNIIERIKSV